VYVLYIPVMMVAKRILKQSYIVDGNTGNTAVLNEVEVRDTLQLERQTDTLIGAMNAQTGRL